MSDLWNKRREKLEKAAVNAAMNLSQFMGCSAFSLPTPIKGFELSLRESSSWASVDERVPPLGAQVLTFDVNFPDDGVHVEKRIGPDDWSTSYSVTHWMSLPAPPTQEEQT